MNNDDSRLDSETFNEWKKELGALEELGDQETIEEAFEKMRNGVWLHCYDYRDTLSIIRSVDMPDGTSVEHVFVFEFDKDDGLVLADASSMKWWTELYADYVNTKGLNLTREQAMAELRKGTPIVTPRYIYFVGEIQCAVPELKGEQFVFVTNRNKPARDFTYIDHPLETFDMCQSDRYGVLK